MTGVDAAIVAVLGVLAAALAVVIARRSPRVAVVASLAVLCLVPVWIGVRLGFNGNLFVPAAVLVALAAGVALVPRHGMRWSLVDGLFGVLLLLTAASLVTGDTALAMSFLVTPYGSFLAGYVVGRVAAARVGAEFVYLAVAVVFTGVAVLAIVEFVTGLNPFVGLQVGNSLFDEWGEIQTRGGFARAEGAFGHSIALGASLALAAPLTLAARLPFVLRLAMVATMLVATVLTFSRIGILCAFLGVILCAILLRDRFTRAQRVAVVGGGAAIGLALLPLVLTVFTEAGEEATASAGYRGDLVSLLAESNIVGLSDSVGRSADGTLRFAGFASIDSQLLLSALTSGWLALALVLVGFAGAIVLCLRGTAQPATIAVVAQLPALATVALITQYSVMLWLVVGIAATTQAALRPSRTALHSSHPAAMATPLRLQPTGD